MKMAALFTENRDSITFALALFIAACGYGIGYFTKDDALKAERDECERLREIIFNSGAEKTPGSDVSGHSRIQESVSARVCNMRGHLFVHTSMDGKYLGIKCRFCGLANWPE